MSDTDLSSDDDEQTSSSSSSSPSKSPPTTRSTRPKRLAAKRANTLIAENKIVWDDERLLKKVLEKSRQEVSEARDQHQCSMAPCKRSSNSNANGNSTRGSPSKRLSSSKSNGSNGKHSNGQSSSVSKAKIISSNGNSKTKGGANSNNSQRVRHQGSNGCSRANGSMNGGHESEQDHHHHQQPSTARNQRLSNGNAKRKSRESGTNGTNGTAAGASAQSEMSASITYGGCALVPPNPVSMREISQQEEAHPDITPPYMRVPFYRRHVLNMRRFAKPNGGHKDNDDDDGDGDGKSWRPPPIKSLIDHSEFEYGDEPGQDLFTTGSKLIDSHDFITFVCLNDAEELENMEVPFPNVKLASEVMAPKRQKLRFKDLKQFHKVLAMVRPMEKIRKRLLLKKEIDQGVGKMLFDKATKKAEEENADNDVVVLDDDHPDHSMQVDHVNGLVNHNGHMHYHDDDDDDDDELLDEQEDEENDDREEEEDEEDEEQTVRTTRSKLSKSANTSTTGPCNGLLEARARSQMDEAQRKFRELRRSRPTTGDEPKKGFLARRDKDVEAIRAQLNRPTSGSTHTAGTSTVAGKKKTTATATTGYFATRSSKMETRQKKQQRQEKTKLKFSQYDDCTATSSPKGNVVLKTGNERTSSLASPNSSDNTRNSVDQVIDLVISNSSTQHCISDDTKPKVKRTSGGSKKRDDSVDKAGQSSQVDDDDDEQIAAQRVQKMLDVIDMVAKRSGEESIQDSTGNGVIAGKDIPKKPKVRSPQKPKDRHDSEVISKVDKMSTEIGQIAKIDKKGKVKSENFDNVCKVIEMVAMDGVMDQDEDNNNDEHCVSIDNIIEMLDKDVELQCDDSTMAKDIEKSNAEKQIDEIIEMVVRQGSLNMQSKEVKRKLDRTPTIVKNLLNEMISKVIRNEGFYDTVDSVIEMVVKQDVAKEVEEVEKKSETTSDPNYSAPIPPLSKSLRFNPQVKVIYTDQMVKLAELRQSVKPIQRNVHFVNTTFLTGQDGLQLQNVELLPDDYLRIEQMKEQRAKKICQELHKVAQNCKDMSNSTSICFAIADRNGEMKRLKVLPEDLEAIKALEREYNEQISNKMDIAIQNAKMARLEEQPVASRLVQVELTRDDGQKCCVDMFTDDYHHIFNSNTRMGEHEFNMAIADAVRKAKWAVKNEETSLLKLPFTSYSTSSEIGQSTLNLVRPAVVTASDGSVHRVRILLNDLKKFQEKRKANADQAEWSVQRIEEAVRKATIIQQSYEERMAEAVRKGQMAIEAMEMAVRKSKQFNDTIRKVTQQMKPNSKFILKSNLSELNVQPTLVSSNEQNDVKEVKSIMNDILAKVVKNDHKPSISQEHSFAQNKSDDHCKATNSNNTSSSSKNDMKKANGTVMVSKVLDVKIKHSGDQQYSKSAAAAAAGGSGVGARGKDFCARRYINLALQNYASMIANFDGDLDFIAIEDDEGIKCVPIPSHMVPQVKTLNRQKQAQFIHSLGGLLCKFGDQLENSYEKFAVMAMAAFDAVRIALTQTTTTTGQASATKQDEEVKKKCLKSNGSPNKDKVPSQVGQLKKSQGVTSKESKSKKQDGCKLLPGRSNGSDKDVFEFIEEEETDEVEMATLKSALHKNRPEESQATPPQISQPDGQLKIKKELESLETQVSPVAENGRPRRQSALKIASLKEHRRKYERRVKKEQVEDGGQIAKPKAIAKSNPLKDWKYALKLSREQQLEEDMNCIDHYWERPSTLDLALQVYKKGTQEEIREFEKNYRWWLMPDEKYLLTEPDPPVDKEEEKEEETNKKSKYTSADEIEYLARSRLPKLVQNYKKQLKKEERKRCYARGQHVSMSYADYQRIRYMKGVIKYGLNPVGRMALARDSMDWYRTTSDPSSLPLFQCDHVPKQKVERCPEPELDLSHVDIDYDSYMPNSDDDQPRTPEEQMFFQRIQQNLKNIEEWVKAEESKQLETSSVHRDKLEPTDISRNVTITSSPSTTFTPQSNNDKKKKKKKRSVWASTSRKKKNRKNTGRCQSHHKLTLQS